MNLASADPIRPRTLIHPGPVDPVRVRSQQAPGAQHVRLRLQPGRTLFEALVEPLYAVGIQNASMTLLGGAFSHLQYCVGQPDPSGQTVACYAAPINSGKSYLIFGNATLGKSASGEPLVHCHATFRNETGQVRGGHLLPTHSNIGQEPISVLVTALEGFELRVVFDPETQISLLQPCETLHHA